MGSRLEFLLIPIAFAVGVASVPMVGMAIGAGLVTRARKVAWTAGTVAGLVVGLVGLVVALKPTLWIALFTSDPGVTAAASSVFRAGRTGLRLLRRRRVSLFLLAGRGQGRRPGAGRDHSPAGGRHRRLVAGRPPSAPAWTLFALVGAAMVAFGLATIVSIRLARWG